MGVLNNVKTVVKTPYVFLEWLVRQPIIRNLVSDRAAISMMYRFRFNRNMNWDNPQTINEKFLWKTVYDRNPIYTVLADKYEAKRWISEKLARGRLSEN